MAWIESHPISWTYISHRSGLRVTLDPPGNDEKAVWNDNSAHWLRLSVTPLREKILLCYFGYFSSNKCTLLSLASNTVAKPSKDFRDKLLGGEENLNSHKVFLPSIVICSFLIKLNFDITFSHTALSPPVKTLHFSSKQRALIHRFGLRAA